MTTLAYKDGIVATDSRAATDGGLIVNDECDKSLEYNGVMFFFCGEARKVKNLAEAYFEEGEGLADYNVSAFAWDTNTKTLTMIGTSEDGRILKQPVDLKVPSALGSGSLHALTAMDMGCNAKDAVRMAMKRDMFTGGKIKTYRLR